MKTTEIGKYLYNKLISNTDLYEIVKNRVFPCVAENGTKSPFITYSRYSSNSLYTKDNLVSETCNISIDCVAITYSMSVEIAMIVRGILDNLQELPLRFKLNTSSETWNEDMYIQTLQYEVEIDY
jgi:hypothetical protein